MQIHLVSLFLLVTGPQLLVQEGVLPSGALVLCVDDGEIREFFNQ